MNNTDWAFIGYVIIMLIGFYVSYKYGSYMIKKTGLFLPQTFIAGSIIVAIDILAVIGWAYFTFGTNEFIFVMGIIFGFGVLVISEMILIAILLFKRKKFI